MTKYYLGYLIICSLLTFAMYGIDKRRAKRRVWRISERMLLGMAAVGGSAGALLGMKVFHHKTRKTWFAVGVPFMLFAHIVLLAVIYKNFG